jgi:hypothetical protein
MATKIVKIPESDYQNAVLIAEKEGMSLGSSVAFVHLRRFQAERAQKQSGTDKQPESIQIRLPSGRAVIVGTREK